MAKKIPQINASSMADISFLLLIFFLVTTSMDVNQGLARRLPAPIPPDQKIEDSKIKERNLMMVKINSMNQLIYKDGTMQDVEYIDIRQLKDRVKKFVSNEDNNEHLPVLFEEDFGGKIGVVRYTKDHVISVQNDVDTQYQAYLTVQNELVAAYNELRNEFAKDVFRKPYSELDEDNQKLIQKIYPQKISEAEPKNYGGN